MYSGVPNKCPPRLFIFQKLFQPPAAITTAPCLLNFLLRESNSQAIYWKKYLLSQKVFSRASLKILEVNTCFKYKVFSKASLKILEVNIHAQWFA